MASSGTMRGTPNRGQGRGGIPGFTNSPAASSNIPRPAHEHSTPSNQSEAGSTMSASRAKQSKRDEVFTGGLIFNPADRL
jgi:hypothetical protein